MPLTAEISRDAPLVDERVEKVLRWYGAAILVGHVICCGFFLHHHRTTILARTEAMCWPFFPGCAALRFGERSGVYLLYAAYFAATCGAAFFLRAKRLDRLRWAIAGLALFLAAIVSLDYRLRQNQFYMFLWVNLVYVFAREKLASLMILIVSFYFWAGHLKLNYEWLSGVVLYHELWFIPAALRPAACTYVVVLEMIFIWGLLVPKARIRWLVFGQLALFHLESLSQIGWFYPAIMGAILSIFPLAWRQGLLPLNVADLVRGRAPKPVYAVAALFGAMQLVPSLYHGDSTLTGQGRIFALHMFEAKQVCEGHAVVHRKSESERRLNLKVTSLPPREICDPVIFFDRASNLCDRYADDPDFIDLDVTLKAKRTSDKAFTSIIAEPNFCHPRRSYRIFTNNDWLKSDPL